MSFLSLEYMKNLSGSGYDRIAPIYDDLVGVIFGKDIFDAQTNYFEEIEDGSRILILGGGSGWILPVLIDGKQKVEIVYIDSSKKMIELSKKKTQTNMVEFICGTEEMIPSNLSFDLIITNFYLDSFSEHELPVKIEYIRSFMNPQGKWIITDFVDTGKRSDRWMLWLMHCFFRLLVKHPNKKLVDWEKALSKLMPNTRKEASWKDGFIRSILIEK